MRRNEGATKYVGKIGMSLRSGWVSDKYCCKGTKVADFNCLHDWLKFDNITDAFILQELIYREPVSKEHDSTTSTLVAIG